MVLNPTAPARLDDMESLRFLMVTTHYPPQHIGGDAVMVKYLSDELTRRGHEVHILRNIRVYQHLRHDVITEPRLESIDDAGVVIHEFEGGRSSADIAANIVLGNDHRPVTQLKKLIADIRPDVVHWHNTKAFMRAPISFPSLVNAYTAHDYFAVCPKGSLLKPDGSVCQRPHRCALCLAESRKLPQLWRLGTKRTIDIPRDVKMIAPSSFMAARLQEDGLGVARVIPNFVEDPGAISSRPDWDSLVFVGILEPHKGPDLLLNAFVSGLKDHEFSLTIIGEGSLKPLLVKRVEEAGVTHRVRILGRVSPSDLRRHLMSALAAAIPSVWFENCPLVAIEALAHGIPLLASRIGGLPEIATEEAGSMTFEPGSVTDLRDKISEVLSASSYDMTLRSRARLAYEKKYTPNRNIREYLDIVKAG